MRIGVLALQGAFTEHIAKLNQLALVFHPELTDDTTVYEYFIEMVKNRI